MKRHGAMRRLIGCLVSAVWIWGSPGSAGAAELDEMSAAVRRAAERVLPAVVVVEPISTGDARSGEVQLSAPTSGLVVDPAGYILTSSLPVASDSAAVLVTTGQGDRYAANLVARDYHRDLALLKVSPEEPMAAMRISGGPFPPIGSTTVAVGRYSSAAGPMVAAGILSATSRLEGVAIQIDARVSPSFYGGPVVDLRGQLLGVLVPAVGEAGAENPTDWYDSGVAFAIEAPAIAAKIESLKSGVDVHRGLLGIVAPTKDGNDKNTTLSAVRPRSPAEAAGLRAGDRVVSVADRAVDRFGAIRHVLGRFDAGDVVAIEVDRDGDRQTFEVTLAREIPPLTPQRIGLRLAEDRRGDPGDDAEDNDGPIVVGVDPTGEVAAPLEVGDRIAGMIDDQGEVAEISDIGSLRSRLMVLPEESEIRLRVVRRGEPTTVAVTTTTIAETTEFAGAESLGFEPPDQTWITEAFDLPTASGVSAILGPKPDADGDAVTLSLAILLSDSKVDDPKTLIESFAGDAAAAGVVVCVITPSSDRGWQLKDIETVSTIRSALGKRYRLAGASISSLDFADDKSTTSDRMAIAAAFSMVGQIDGVLIDPQTRPPAIRLKENEASQPIQFLLPADRDESTPDLGVSLGRAGYPVLTGSVDRDRLLRWTYWLQTL